VEPCLGIEAHLDRARAGWTRLTPAEAAARVQLGAVIVDTRPEFQRRRDGEVPGAVVVERNHLEWRLDPTSGASIPEAADRDVTWIVLCDQGYSSSLAAHTLRLLGIRNATDVIGGFQSWRAAGLPVTHPRTPTAPRLSAPQPPRSRPGLRSPSNLDESGPERGGP
jgi:rhodanese-related sulfurtransferase